MSAPLNAAQSAFFLAGPTAVGKTDIALAVAEACHGEIVGADAFQVYRGLDLLTAKPAPADLARVPHHLVGSLPLADAFNVGRYQEAALAAIAEIRSRGRLPIVTGGTGLYLRALTRGLADLPPASAELRARLASTPLDELLRQLAALDPQAATSVDAKNPRRVQRALEVCLVTGQPFSSFRQQWEEMPPFCGVLLERPREQLYERIEARTHAMFEQGVVEEVVQALAQGGVGPTAEQVIGWREITAFLRGELTQAQCIAAIQQATRRYAKRQLTWFAREPGYRRVSLETSADLGAILECAAAVQ